MEKDKSNNPLISIVTICLNSEKTVERTILSVLNQTYKNIEYIIIDGGSSDNTINIIKKYRDRISYFISEKDKGISDGFNKGILASNGEIIGILNSDDWYEENAVEKVVQTYEKEKADLYIGALRYWLPDGRNTLIYPDKKYKRIIKSYMPHLPHPSTFVTKDTYKEIGLFDTKYKYAMDYDFFLRAYENNKKFILINELITNMQAGGVSYVYKKQAYKEVFKISSNKILGLCFYTLFLIRYFFWKRISSEKLKATLYIIFYKIKKLF